MKKNRKAEKNARSFDNGNGKSESKLKRHGLHESRIDLSEKVRTQCCQILNQTLADMFDMYSQTKQAHWNVKGAHFYQLHLLFDEIAGDLIEYVDTVAERITTLGGTAFGTVRMSADSSALPEYPVGNLAGMDHVSALADRLSQLGTLLRENIDETDELGDADTADLYTGLSRDVDKWLWFLEAHLQAPTAEREPKSRQVETASRN